VARNRKRGDRMPEPAAPTVPNQVAAGQRQIGEIVVEVCDEANNNHLWNPTQTRLRGRWDWAKVPRGETSERGLHKMPVLPGITITVNPRERRAVIEDPLGHPDNARVLAEASGVHASIWQTGFTFVERVVRENMTPDQIATWLYWVRRGVEGGHLRVLSGKMFTLEELAAAYPTARIRRQFYDSAAYRVSRQRDTVGTREVAEEESSPLMS
jgi:hypothetical protein